MPEGSEELSGTSGHIGQFNHLLAAVLLNQGTAMCSAYSGGAQIPEGARMDGEGRRT